MKKSFFFLSCFFLFLLTFVGCSLSSSGGSPFSTGGIGTGQGIEVNFMKNFPPPVIYARELKLTTIKDIGKAKEVRMELEFRNKGTYQGPFYFEDYYTGFDTNIFTIRSEKDPSETDLTPVSRYDSVGGYSIATALLTLEENALGSAAQYEATIEYNLCYNYQTKEALSICIDSGRDENECRSDSVSATTGGAPLVLSNIDIENRYERTRVEVTLSAPKKYQILAPTADCKNPPSTQQGLVVIQEIEMAGKQPESCSVTLPGTLRLKNNEITFWCLFDTFSTRNVERVAYDSLLSVTANYKVKTVIERDITIVNDE